VASSQPVAEPEADQILDAARSTVLDFGLRRATVTEVARRAGLSRITVYRRYRDGGELIRALMIREFSALIERAQRETEGSAPGRQRVVELLCGGVALLAENALFVRLLTLEPERLIPYLVGEPGRFQLLARQHLAREIRAGQENGSVRCGDPAEIAAALETAARGATFAAPAQPPAARARSLQQLRELVQAYLRPEETM
jgi:AcrR family transcriptional regulator